MREAVIHDSVVDLEVMSAPPLPAVVTDRRAVGWRLTIAGIGLSALAVAGCSASDGPHTNESTPAIAGSSSFESTPIASVPATSETPTTALPTSPSTESSSTTSHITIAGCEQPGVPVSPDLHFNAQNAIDIQGQLDSLTIAKSPGTKVKTIDVIHASAAFGDSLTDPVYAKAVSFALSHPGVTARQLLAMTSRFDDVSNCLTKAQVHNADQIGREYLRYLAPKVGTQMSLLAETAYRELAGKFNAFANDHDLPRVPVN